MQSISIFDIFLGGIGLYALVSGIVGKGRLYTTQSVKEGCEEKIMKGQSVLYVIIGASMMLNAFAAILLSSLYNREVVEQAYVYTPKGELGSWSVFTPGLLSVLTFVFMGLSLVSIIVLIVFLKKMTIRASAQKGDENGKDGKAPQQSQSFMPSAAFDFTDEEKTNPRKK